MFHRLLGSDKGPRMLADVLTTHPSIRILNLRGTGIAIGIAEAWTSVFRKNDVITELNFSGTPHCYTITLITLLSILDCFGVDDYRSIDDGLRLNKTITSLNLSSPYCKITVEILYSIYSHCFFFLICNRELDWK